MLNIIRGANITIHRSNVHVGTKNRQLDAMVTRVRVHAKLCEQQVGWKGGLIYLFHVVYVINQSRFCEVDDSLTFDVVKRIQGPLHVTPKLLIKILSKDRTINSDYSYSPK